MSGYFLNGIDISNYLVESTSTSTTVSGFNSNGIDIAKKYRLSTDGIGISQSRSLNYKLNNIDLSTFFFKYPYTSDDIINPSSTPSYTFVNRSDMFHIMIKSGGNMFFKKNLAKIYYTMAGGGGAGGVGDPLKGSGGGGGAGEVAFGNINNSGQNISYITAIIGAGGVGTISGYGVNGGQSKLFVNSYVLSNSYRNCLANGGGGGAKGGSGVTGNTGGCGGGGSYNANGGSSSSGSGDISNSFQSNMSYRGYGYRGNTTTLYGGSGGSPINNNNIGATVYNPNNNGLTIRYADTNEIYLTFAGGGGGGRGTNNSGSNTISPGGYGGTINSTPYNGTGYGSGGGGACYLNNTPTVVGSGSSGFIEIIVMYTDVL